MLIDRVQVLEFGYTGHNLARPLAEGGTFGYRAGGQIEMRSFAVRITTDDGASGTFVPFQGSTATAYAETVKLAPRLLGHDPFERERLNLMLRLGARSGDGSGVGALDIALWDLAGHCVKQSVARMLGGWKTRLPTYVSTYRFNRADGYDNSIYIEFARACRDRGIPGYKIHPPYDNDMRQEIALVSELRAAVGEDMELMLDPAALYQTFHHGLMVGRACDDAGYRWIEDPFADLGRSIFANRRLREQIKTPVLQGERVRSLEQKADLIVGQGTDSIRADPELDYGITGLMKVAHLAEAFGIDIEVANGAPAQRHCIAAIRNTTYYEICNVGPDTPSNATPPIYRCGYADQVDGIDADGCVSVPAGPGLGVDYDWDFIQANVIQHHDFRLGDLTATPAFPQ